MSVLQETSASGRSVPLHVAIIMDGNGRWARGRALGRIHGHYRGVQVVRSIVKHAKDRGVKYLTLYAFSDENWRRPRREVRALMWLLRGFLRKWLDELKDNGVRLRAIGELGKLPQSVRDILDHAVDYTSGNDGIVLTLALSYGGRQELVRAVRAVCDRVVRGELRPEDVDEGVLSSNLYTAGMPDPDLLIRTSGEMRISNFLLWQLAYTEIYITDKFWPDFTPEDFDAALEDYARRERRFGMTGEQVRGVEVRT